MKKYRIFWSLIIILKYCIFYDAEVGIWKLIGNTVDSVWLKIFSDSDFFFFPPRTPRHRESTDSNGFYLPRGLCAKKKRLTTSVLATHRKRRPSAAWRRPRRCTWPPSRTWSPADGLFGPVVEWTTNGYFYFNSELLSRVMCCRERLWRRNVHGNATCACVCVWPTPQRTRWKRNRQIRRTARYNGSPPLSLSLSPTSQPGSFSRSTLPPAPPPTRRRLTQSPASWFESTTLEWGRGEFFSRRVSRFLSIVPETVRGLTLPHRLPVEKSLGHSAVVTGRSNNPPSRIVVISRFRGKKFSFIIFFFF